MRLELIVRPFQTLDVTPPARIVNADDAVVPNLALALGFEGDIKTLNGSFSTSQSSYTDDAHVELTRETTVKRITNPDDDSQFLDVEQINKLTTEKGTGTQYKKSTFDFKNT